jgi:hypothetical protein
MIYRMNIVLCYLGEVLIIGRYNNILLNDFISVFPCSRLLKFTYVDLSRNMTKFISLSPDDVEKKKSLSICIYD